MNEQTHAEHGEEHQPKRQPQHRATIAEEFVLRNTPAVEEQERRYEQQEEQFGIEFDADMRDHPD